MLGKALQQERMFAVAHAEEEGGVSPIAGLGIVRACVANPDGTSNLILQGTARVVISGLKMSPFPHACLTVLDDKEPNGLLCQNLRSDVEKAFLEIRKTGFALPQGFASYLAQIAHPGAYADAIASAFVQDPMERRGLLEEAHVPTRLSRLLRFLMRHLRNP